MNLFTRHHKTSIISVVIVSLAFLNCKNQKTEDTKEVAEEHNEGKFNDPNKEKDAPSLVNTAEINLKEICLGKLAQQESNNLKFIRIKSKIL